MISRTVKVKINVPEGFLIFMETCSAIYNSHIEWCFSTKTYNKSKAHEDLYFKIRELYPDIPSALIQTMRDNALESVKSTKFKYKPIKKPHSSIRYDKRTVQLTTNNLLKLTWSGDRIKQNITIPSWFSKRYPNYKFQSATISYDKSSKQFYANLIYLSEEPNKIHYSELKTVGIDRGLYNIITLSDGLKINSKQIRKNKRKHLYLKRKLQAKGTSSAKKKLKFLRHKEARFSLNQNHIISKMLVNLPYDTFVLEDLTNIAKKSKNISKKNNKWLHSWSFFQLEQLLSYKCLAKGKSIVKVDARYTSQKCSSCGNIDKKSRNKEKYCCIKCGYKNHSDINAAINIKQNYLISRQALSEESGLPQAAVNQPNGEEEISDDFESLMYQQKNALKILYTKC